MASTASVGSRSEELFKADAGTSIESRVCRTAETRVGSCRVAGGAGRIAGQAVEGAVQIESRSASALSVEQQVGIRSAGQTLVRQSPEASQTARVADNAVRLKIERVAGTCAGVGSKS